MAFAIYVFSVFLSAACLQRAPVLSVVFAIVALTLVFQAELRWLAGVLRASPPHPRTDP